MLAIDATNYGRHDRSSQFGDAALERETNKAFVGFSQSGFIPGGFSTGDLGATSLAEPSAAAAAQPLPVCTGNWGCGAFGGDLQLKALLQLIAASVAGRPSLVYFTFGDDTFAARLQALNERLRALECTVGMLVNLLQVSPARRVRVFRVPRVPLSRRAYA